MAEGSCWKALQNGGFHDGDTAAVPGVTLRFTRERSIDL